VAAAFTGRQRWALTPNPAAGARSPEVNLPFVITQDRQPRGMAMRSAAGDHVAAALLHHTPLHCRLRRLQHEVAPIEREGQRR
jgi:hypothetical protein